MNLTKLFNFSYCMQNIKKSKALIILLMLLVPLFTSIVIISTEEDYAFSFIELSAVNLIGMYIIPIVLSIALFGYVYKKSSVDFIGSMPISRRTVFLTNTIGGIAILTITQLLTLICTMLLSKIFSNVIIFGSMVWDIFLFYTMGYIFVFTVANLAMTISGNKIAQLVSTALILFVIPFLIITGRLYYEEENGYNTIREERTINISEPYHFTAPSYVFDALINGNEFMFDSGSVVRMIVLSLVYIGIGLVLFQKKKLEMAGEAYETRNMHLVIKLLTMLPFMAIFCGLSDSDKVDIFLFFFAIVAVYYFVFDLVTNKKLKLKITIPAFLGSLAVLFAFYEGIAPNLSFLRNEVQIKVNDIESILIEDIQSNRSSRKKFDLLIEDEELVKLIAKNFANYYNYRTTGVYVEDISDYEMVTEEIKIAEAIPIEKDKEGSNATFILKLKNGKEYEYYDYLNYNVWKQIFAKYGTQNPMQEFNNMKVALRRIDLTSKEEKEILEIFNQTMNQFTYQELYDIYQSDSSEYTLYLYEYQNHQLIQRNYSKKLPKEVFQKIITICNSRAIDIVEEVPRISIGNESEFVEFLQEYMIKYYGDKIQYKDETVSENSLDNNIEKNNLKISLLKELYLVDNDGEYYDLYDETREEIQKFIVKEATETIDISKDYVVIKAFYPNYMWYYTNNTDAVCKIFVDKYFEILERVNYDVEE